MPKNRGLRQLAPEEGGFESMRGSTLLERLISQLDTLVSFLGIARDDVFRLLQREKVVWFGVNERRALPSAYETYRTHITHSAFLLGYSYFEAFLADLVRNIFLLNPAMLPRDRELKFHEILAGKSYETTLRLMIEKEILSSFHEGMEETSNYFEKKLKISWPKGEKERVVIASLLRNCLIHNMGRIDRRLGAVPDYREGELIQLTPEEVHSYGLVARSLARTVFTKAESKYIKRTRAGGRRAS